MLNLLTQLLVKSSSSSWSGTAPTSFGIRYRATRLLWPAPSSSSLRQMIPKRLMMDMENGYFLNLWNEKFALSNIFLFYFWNQWTFSYYIFGIYGIKSLLCLSNIFFVLALWRQCIDVWSIYSSPISNSTISDFQNGVGDDEDYEDDDIIYNANYVY